MAGWVRWYFSIVTLPYPYDPSKTLWAFDIRRDTDTGETSFWSANYIVTEEWQVDFEIEVGEVDYGADYFRKWGFLWYTDLNLGERTFSYWEVVVPPFNGLWTEGTAFHAQVHDVGVPPTPPPPILPPPQPPTPIFIPPPEGPPIERPLEPKPEEPPFQPPDRPPPTFGPPDRQPPPRLTNDYLTWNLFVAKYGDRIKRWALEVPLDYGDLPPDPNAPPQYKAMWQRLTGHKADAFIDFGHVIYVAEIKPRLTLAALGQAYFGWQLAVKRYRFDKPVKPCVICSTAPHSLLPIASQNGITVFVLEGITGGQPEE